MQISILVEAPLLRIQLCALGCSTYRLAVWPTHEHLVRGLSFHPFLIRTWVQLTRLAGSLFHACVSVPLD